MISHKTAALVDVFPLLRYLPDFMLPLRRHAKELHQRELNLFVGHYRDTRERLRAGTAKVNDNIDSNNSAY